MLVHCTEAVRFPASVLTIGAFDGVHRGHQALISRGVSRAKALGIPSVAYTFDPPPKVYFQQALALMPLVDKLEKLEDLGLDHVIIARFNEQYAARGTEDFLAELSTLNPEEVWVGRDFRFGRLQSGDLSTLGSRFNVRVLEPTRCSRGEIISSTRVRRLRAKGSLLEARMLLGWSA